MGSVDGHPQQAKRGGTHQAGQLRRQLPQRCHRELELCGQQQVGEGQRSPGLQLLRGQVTGRGVGSSAQGGEGVAHLGMREPFFFCPCCCSPWTFLCPMCLQRIHNACAAFPVLPPHTLSVTHLFLFKLAHHTWGKKSELSAEMLLRPGGGWRRCGRVGMGGFLFLFGGGAQSVGFPEFMG